MDCGDSLDTFPCHRSHEFPWALTGLLYTWLPLYELVFKILNIVQTKGTDALTNMCVYNWPPVFAVCLNHEVVVFQPRTGTALDVGSIDSYNFHSSPPTPPVSTVFLDLSISLLHPTTPPPVTACHLITSLCCIRSPPPLPAWNAAHLDIVHIRHPPASAAWLCAPRFGPASAAVSLIYSSPLCRPRPAPRSLSAPGGFAHCGFLRLPSASALPSMCAAPTPGTFWFLVSCRVAIFARGREARAPPLPGNCSPRAPPPRYLAMPAPFSPPPPLLSSWPHPRWLKAVGRSAIS